jgi:MarR family transcriptional repressor of emrRAB
MNPDFPHAAHPPPDVHGLLSAIFNIEDMSQMDLFFRLKATAHLLDHLTGHCHKPGRLSAARMRLLIRLIVAAQIGPHEGLSPSDLSDFLGVSRNTISALLSGLEEQGLIERRLHPTDRRQFLIRISPAGQDLVRQRAPQFAALVGSLFDVLSPEEQQTLLALLTRLSENLFAKAAAGPDMLPTLDQLGDDEE